jgi:hypothetical protein
VASNALTRLYPLANKAYRASRTAWDHWQSLPQSERERYVAMARDGVARLRKTRIATNPK